MRPIIVIPTYNGGELWCKTAAAIKSQSIECPVLVIDSSSTDSTRAVAEGFGFFVHDISPKDFNHGGTRNLAYNLYPDYDLYVFLTQDAIFETNDALSHLVSFFEFDSTFTAASGRQLSHFDANPIASHARCFNYPSENSIRSDIDIPALGLKVAFMSNSFAAYRRDAFERLGGFPENTILAEDMYLASKMILSGYKVAYCAEACVRHSHNYTPWEEFRRYFDTGVFHACEPWIQEQLGGASGEGMRFVKSELRFLLKNAPLWIPRALLTTACKLVGYKLGKSYKRLPKSWCPKLSMYKSYWLQQK